MSVLISLHKGIGTESICTHNNNNLQNMTMRIFKVGKNVDLYCPTRKAR